MNLLIWLSLAAFLIAGFFGLFHIGGILLLMMGLLIAVALGKGWISPIHAPRFLHFFYDFLIDLAVSNFMMIYDVFTPRDMHHVKLIRVSVDDLKDWEIALLNHRINLTPGTLVVYIDRDRKFLYVHDMYGQGEIDKNLRAPLDILKGKKSQ